MNNIEIIKQIDKELNILYICIIQIIINSIIAIVIKKKVFPDENHVNRILRSLIWKVSTLPIIIYTYPMYKQNFLASLLFILVTPVIIGYYTYQLFKIEKKYGLLSLLLSLNFLLVGCFILFVFNL